MTLSETLRVALRVPFAVGVKVTLIVHDVPAARPSPQVLVSAKSAAFEPVKVTLLMSTLSVPVLVSVATRAALVVFRPWLANVSAAGVRVTDRVIPVPLSPTVCAPLEALLATVTVAAGTQPPLA